ncbi:protein of unknown function [Faunimonas pinastri]|uniref:DUF1849 family protein n=1 Tax=Faunimonas pinastri TaxID=1855383 RepID=A0A1H9CHC5_9HYPH|nr:DUF1849 family protein [Faunimonas pinastri]SEQ00417.1 protein of unknown function [Faunimonas pinastri]
MTPPYRLSLPLVATFILTGTAFAQAVPGPGVKPTTIPVPHRATYKIDLAHVAPNAGVTGASGEMVYEVKGSSCAGFTTTQRLVVQIGRSEQDDRKLDFQATSFEPGNGATYRFSSRTLVDDQPTDSLKGFAEKTPDGLSIELEEPEAKQINVSDKVIFPGQHLQSIVDAAKAGQKFFSTHTYEGSGTGTAPDTASAVIGASRVGQDDDMTKGLRFWPVSVAYFDHDKAKTTDDKTKLPGEQTPSYQTSFKLYENGVSKDLILDYGDYSLSGKLEKLEALPPAACNH